LGVGFYMHIVGQLIQLTAESAHLFYNYALEHVQYGKDVESVSEVNSIGSGWGKRERPTRELRSFHAVEI